jgi:hypothetical protein
MPTLSHLPGALQNIFLQTARQAGLESRFLLRRSKLSPEAFVQTLVFGRLANPSASLQQLSQTAALVGTDLSPQALDQRFNRKAADCLKLVLEAALQQVFAADPVTVPLLERFTRVHLIDTSVIVLPDELLEVWAGCGGSSGKTSALKVEVGLELRTGRLDGPHLHNGRTHDNQGLLHRSDITAGSLRLADLAYFDLKLLRALNEQQSYWITRVTSTTKVVDDVGNRLTILEFLKAQGSERVDTWVKLGQTEQLACRMVAVKVSRQVADERRRRRKDKARRNGQTVKQATLELADWSIYVTNVGREKLEMKEVYALARARWQIELIFKLWKSQGKVDEWRSKKGWRILCEVYAKLLGMLIQHWLVVLSGWKNEDRSVWQAGRVVQMLTPYLATAMRSVNELSGVIELMGRCIGAGCRMNKRKKAPSSFQLLSDGALA